MNPAIRKLARWAERNGLTVRDDASGYTRFYTPDGRFVACYPATPGNPVRRMHDLDGKLKAEGLEIPPPSKKILRSRRRKGL